MAFLELQRVIEAAEAEIGAVAADQTRTAEWKQQQIAAIQAELQVKAQPLKDAAAAEIEDAKKRGQVAEYRLRAEQGPNSLEEWTAASVRAPFVARMVGEAELSKLPGLYAIAAAAGDRVGAFLIYEQAMIITSEPARLVGGPDDANLTPSVEARAVREALEKAHDAGIKAKLDKMWANIAEQEKERSALIMRMGKPSLSAGSYRM